MKSALIYFAPIMLHVHFVFGQNVLEGHVYNDQNEPIKPYQLSIQKDKIYDLFSDRRSDR